MNPTALVFVAFCTVLGLIFGHGLIAAAIALGIVLVCSFANHTTKGTK